MKSRVAASSTLSVVGMVLLALVAIVLSGAALLQSRSVTAVPEAPVASAIQPAESAEPSTSSPPPASPSPSAGEGITPEAPDPTSSATSPSADGPTVVVIGDSNSVEDEEGSWVDAVAESLGWGSVINLSSPGRGFYAAPRSCNLDPCDNFGGSIELIQDEQPDVVITFGGTADGDVALGDAATSYFEGLRDALPDAELIAISPVTGADEWPYFMTMHQQSIRAAVEGVGGTMIDVGRVGLGEDPLSAESHAEITQIVVDELE